MFNTFLQTAVQSPKRDAIGQYMGDAMVNVAMWQTIQRFTSTSSAWEEKYTVGKGAREATSNKKKNLYNSEKYTF